MIVIYPLWVYFGSWLRVGSSCLATLDIHHRHPHLLYNTGVELLFSGQSSAAFNCLLEAVKVFHASPLVWLRLAEACIAVNRKVRFRYLLSGVRSLLRGSECHCVSTKCTAGTAAALASNPSEFKY